MLEKFVTLFLTELVLQDFIRVKKGALNEAAQSNSS